MAWAVGLKAWTIQTEAVYILDSPSSVLDRLIDFRINTFHLKYFILRDLRSSVEMSQVGKGMSMTVSRYTSWTVRTIPAAWLIRPPTLTRLKRILIGRERL